MEDITINVASMDPQQILNYQQTLVNNVFTQRIKQNEEQIKIWTEYKNKHKMVIEGLEVFPLSVSMNCMVPIGKRALMKGKLTHTNEVLACLGDGYFAKYSASQAIALCKRRIAWADEVLKNLEVERNLYETRQNLPLKYDVFGKLNRNDILEHCNEEELNEWKVQHRLQEKKYHQELSKLREKESSDIHTEDLFKRLDELELQEELEEELELQEELEEQLEEESQEELEKELQNEMSRLATKQQQFYRDDLKENEVYDESEEDSSNSSDEIPMDILEEELKKVKTRRNRNVNNIRDKCFNTNAIENEQTDQSTNSSQNILTKTCLPEISTITENVKKKSRVSFVEPCNVSNQKNNEREKQDNVFNNGDSKDENDTIVIQFLHSNNTANISESNNTEIQSPLDIYKMFNTPKSILKKSQSDVFPNHVPLLNDDSSTDAESEEDCVKSVYNTVIKDIQEAKVTPQVTTNSENGNDKKVISRFKMERSGIRK